MIKLKYNNYSEMTIEDFIHIKSILNSDKDENSKEFELISVLSGIPIDDLMEMKLSELQGITPKCAFLGEEVIQTQQNINAIVINGIKYIVCDDLKNFTVAQYVDFQNYPKDEQHLAENLSTFVIPEGKKYAEGYDIVKTIRDFNKFMPISSALSLQNFFTEKLVNCTKDTLHYSLQLMKKELKKTKMKKEEKTKIMNQIKQIQQDYGYQLQIQYQKP